MTLPASAPISFSQVVTEFGLIGTKEFSDYYRNGNLVLNTSLNSGIATTPPLALSQFYGAAEFLKFGPTGGDIVLSMDNSAGQAVSRILIQTSGTFTREAIGDGVIQDSGPTYWGTPTTTSAGDVYECRITVISSFGAGTAYTLNIFGVTREDPDTFANGYQTAWTPITSQLVFSARGGAANASYGELIGTLEFRKKFDTSFSTSTGFTLAAQGGTL